MTGKMREEIKPIKIVKGSDQHFTLLMAPDHLNLVVGEDRKALLRYGQRVWQAATLAERERCALVCEAQHEGDSIDDDLTEPAYNAALRHAADAIKQGGEA